MKSAIFKKPGHIEVQSMEIPEIGPSDILLKVKACAVCGTDLRIFKGEKTAGIHLPTTIGHEFSGVIEKKGEEVKDFQVGDKVVVAPVVSCLTCYYCKNNRENACLNRRAFGYEYDGGFSEYVRIPDRVIWQGNVIKFGDNLPFEVAALSEPLGCCIHGNRRSKISIGDTVVIIGAGPIGLMHLMLAKLSGATNIIVSEPLATRRTYAEAFGANRVVNPESEELVEIIDEETNGLGADSLIMAIGVPNLVNQLLKLVKKGGYINFFAGFPKGVETAFNPNPIHYGELNVTGTASAKRRDVELALSLIENDKIEVKKLITHRFPLKKIREALETAMTKEGLKIIVNP